MSSKRYRKNQETIEKGRVYTLDEALDTLKKLSQAKFDESVEAHFKLGIDPKKTEQQVRGMADLPFGTGKSIKIAVFSGDLAEVEKARALGVSQAGGEELINQIKAKGEIDFDIAVATPDIMAKMAQIAKVLGPRGLMPNPKNETVTKDVKKTVEALKKGKINFKNDKGGNIHALFGKLSFETASLKENYNALEESLKKAKPATVKGSFIQSISISSTMGAGIKIQK